MEATTEATTTPQGAPESADVSQDSYIQDAFGDYMADPKGGDGTQATEPKEGEEGAQEPKDGQTEVTEPKEGDGEAKEGEKKPDPFDVAFATESGDFDLEKLMGVSVDGLDFQKDETQQTTEKPDAKTNVPAWKQEYETERAFRENIQKSRLGPLESVFNQIQKHAEMPEDVKAVVSDMLRAEYAKVQQENDQYFRERDEQSTFKKRQEHDEKIKAEIRNSKLPELARVNASAIIGKLPGEDSKGKIELYNRIMFGPDAGGELLQDMFEIRYPDIASKPKAEQDALRLRFVNELQADGPRLQRHFQRAYRYLTADPKNMKRIMSQVSRATEANTKSNSLAAQKSPAGSVERQPQAGNSMWGQYFADPKGTKTRI